MLRVCRALLGPEEAQDAWSETFLAAMRAYPELRHDQNVAGWLVTIAHNKAIDELRKRSRGPEPTADVPEGQGPSAIGEPVDDELVAAVRALPPKQRAAVVHHYLADLPYHEVGVLLGTSTDAARRSAADGIAALRSTYAKGARR